MSGYLAISGLLSFPAIALSRSIIDIHRRQKLDIRFIAIICLAGALTVIASQQKLVDRNRETSRWQEDNWRISQLVHRRPQR